jgi:DNA-binding beta-propeller fold protein YncE
MKTNARALLSLLLVVLATMFLAGCSESYGCKVTFGSSSCTPSGSGLGGGGGTGGGGGGGGTTPTALAFNIVQTGTVNGIAYSSTGPSLANITGFLAPTVSANDPSSELVIAQQQYLYGIFPSTQLLYGWTIANTGTLTAMSGSPFTMADLGGMISNSTGVKLSGVAVNPAGTFLFIADAGNGLILTFQIGAGGALTAGPTISTIGAVQPWNLAIDGLGKYLYVTEGIEGDGQHVAAYSINQGTGALTLVEAQMPFNIWELQGDPTG